MPLPALPVALRRRGGRIARNMVTRSIILLVPLICMGACSPDGAAAEGKDMETRTPLESYQSYLAERQPGVAEDAIQEVAGYDIGGFKLYRVRGAMGPSAAIAATDGAVIAAMDSWEGWGPLLDSTSDLATLHKVLAALLGDYIPVAPGFAARAEAQALLEPPALERDEPGTIRFVAWYAGPPRVEDPIRITVTVPASGTGTVEYTNWRDIAQPDPVERLATQYDEVDPMGKAVVVRELAELRDPRAVPTLCKAFSENFDRTRIDAAVALGKVGGDDATACLSARMGEEPSEEVRLNIVRALGAIGNEAARNALSDAAANDESADVRSIAGSLLGS